jgi:acetyltransferase-like isoleucine patch superfamily enzyme
MGNRVHDGLARGIRRLHFIGRRLASHARIALLRAQYPGLRVEGRVHISPGCDISVSRGATLALRGCRVERGVTLTAGAGATLDIRADFIGPNSVIVSRDRVVIGEGSQLAEMVVVRDGNHDHSVSLAKMRFTADPVEIGADVWLGAHATVLQGVRVGAGATVAAGAVVIRDVKPGDTVGGVPARPLTRKVPAT